MGIYERIGRRGRDGSRPTQCVLFWVICAFPGISKPMNTSSKPIHYPVWLMALLLTLATCGPSQAGPLGLRVDGVTSTQAVIHYVSPGDEACFVHSAEEGVNALVNDVNPDLFPGSNEDRQRPDGIVDRRERQLVLGRRAAERGLDGKYHSRALQAFTRHRVTVRCGDEVDTAVFDTANPPLGNTYPELPGFAPGRFGNYAWPTIDWTDKNKTYIDPLTGILLKRATGPGDLSIRQPRQRFSYAFDPAGGWTAGTAFPAAETSTATVRGTEPLFLAVGQLSLDYLDAAGFNSSGLGVDDILEQITGSGTDANADHRTFRVCLTIDSGQSCASDVIALTAPRGNSGAVPTPRAGEFPGPPFRRWGGQPIERHLVAPPSGKVDVNGHRVLLLNGGPTSLFDLDWQPGAKIYIQNTEPVCPRHHCTIERVVNSSQVEIRESLPEAKNQDYRAANFGLRVVKNTDQGSLTLSFAYEVAATRMFMTPSDGSNDFCSPKPVTARVDASGRDLVSPLTGYLCVLPTTSGTNALFFYAQETGEIRLLSNFHRPYSGSGGDEFGSYVNVKINSFDANDGTVFYGIASTGSGPYYMTVWRGKYTGDFRSWNSGYTFPPRADQVNWTNLTPASRGLDVAAQLQRRNPKYDRQLFPYLNGVGMIGSYYVFSAYAAQDAPCILAFVDVTTGQLSSSQDSWSLYPGRWGVCHTVQPLGAGDWLLSAINAPRYPEPSTPLRGPFYLNIRQVFKQNDWSDDTSVPANLGEACPPDLDSRWKNLGAIGINCLRIRVGGEPCSASPTEIERQKYPCPHNARHSMLQPIDEGDLFTDFESTGTPFRERFRVVRKRVNHSEDIELTLQRRAECAAPGGDPLPARYFTHANRWRASMSQPGGCWGAGWWIDVSGSQPGWIIEDPALTASHNDYGVGPGTGAYTAIKGGYESRIDSTVPINFGRPFNIQVQAWPTFAGSKALIQGNGTVETYPSMRQWNAVGAERSWTLDFRAYQIGAGVLSETPLALFENSPRLVPGTRQVYLIDNPASGHDLKRLPYVAWAGRHWMRDISGPAAVIGDDDRFAYCVVAVAGECRPESRPGEVFMNVPQATLGQSKPFCATNHYGGNYPCFFTGSPVGGWVGQWGVNESDAKGLRFRRLTMGFSGPGRQYTYANARATPDGKWAFVPGYWLDGYRLDLLMAKLPPWPVEELKPRDNFVPVKVTIAGEDGSHQVRVKFGYAENGPVDQFYCTSRQEACESGGDLFLFHHEAPRTGVSCAGGCEVSVNAIPGRVLFVQVERLDGSGEVLRREPRQAIVVP
jgi:hypothetical protein